jgi:guanylate kinase
VKGNKAIEVARHPFIIVVSGPSGVGKSTVVKKVLAAATRLSCAVSLTSREPREGERDGINYVFVSREEFIRRRDAGELLEWAEVYGNLYGTPARFVDERLDAGVGVLLEIDVQGGESVKKERPDAVLVFLLPPSYEELERRLRGRKTDDEETIRRRLDIARRELTCHDRYDYIVVNDDVGRCAADVLAVIKAEGLRRGRTSVDI